MPSFIIILKFLLLNNSQQHGNKAGGKHKDLDFLNFFPSTGIYRTPPFGKVHWSPPPPFLLGNKTNRLLPLSLK